MAGATTPLASPHPPGPRTNKGFFADLRLLPATLSFAAGICLIVLPALFFTPIVPYIDILGFTAMNGYPAKESYGPQHYYLFQFTYVLPHILSRIMTDLGVSQILQVLFYYLLQALTFYTVVSYLLFRFLRNQAILCLALLFTPLALNDGVFVWGLLAYTLAAVPFAFSVMLILRSELDGTKPRLGLLVVLALLGMLSHPFAVPFFLVLYGVALLLSARHRGAAVILLAACAAYGLLIGRDSPETVPREQLWTLLSFKPSAVIARFQKMLTFERWAFTLLLGRCSPWLQAYAIAVHAMQVLGLAGVAVAWRRMWHDSAARVLLGLGVAYMAMFAFAGETVVISTWPQRVLMMTNVVLLPCGFVTLAGIVERIGAWLPDVHLPTVPVRLGVAAALLGLVDWAVFLQRELLAPGYAVQAAYAKTKQTILDSGVRDARIVVNNRGLYRLVPGCLRAAPLMIFSDPQLVRLRNVTVTEWHATPRHNSRWAETPDGKTWVLDFEPSRPFQIAPVLREPVFLYDLPLLVRFGDKTPSSAPGDPLLTTGRPGDGNVLSALAPSPGVITFSIERPGLPLASSPLIFRDRQREAALRVRLGEEGLRLSLDGVPVWEYIRPMRALANLKIGTNQVGLSATGRFSGSIQLDVSGRPF